MDGLTIEAMEYAGVRYGVTSDEELNALGVNRHRRERLVAAGVLLVVFRGVYRMRSFPETFESRCRAICLAAPHAVITGRAAGRLWGVRLMGRLDRIEVRVPHYCNSLGGDDRIILRRCNIMEPVDVVTRWDGIRVVSPPRLAFDLAADLSDLELESVIEQIIDRRWCTVETIIRLGRRLFHPARPGAVRFAKVMASRPAWLKPVDSNHEMILYDALRRASFTGMTRQHRLELPGGWPIHADVAVPTLRWAIPIDHVTWHGGRIASVRDKQNDRQAGMIGWRVDRVTDEDIDIRLDATVAELVVIRRRLESSVRFDRSDAV